MDSPVPEQQEPEPVWLETPFAIQVLRWPVKERETGDDGRAKRAASSYIRTKEPLERKTVTVDRFLSRSKAYVYFGIGGHRTFSIRTGRCIGLPDWVLDKESQRALRKISKELFPKRKTPRAASPANDVSAEDAKPEEVDE
jgi:hypothetical protein